MSQEGQKMRPIHQYGRRSVLIYAFDNGFHHPTAVTSIYRPSVQPHVWTYLSLMWLCFASAVTKLGELGMACVISPSSWHLSSHRPRAAPLTLTAWKVLDTSMEKAVHGEQ